MHTKVFLLLANSSETLESICLFVHPLFRRKQYGDLRIYTENQCVCVLGEYRALYLLKLD